MSYEAITLRAAHAGDAASLADLAAMEEAAPLAGEQLVAEIDGIVIAAVSMRDGRALADPFRPTAAVVAMLGQRRRQLIDVRRPARRPTVRRGERILGVAAAAVGAGASR